MLNPTEAIEYLTKQADFCAKRAEESTTEVSILSYAGRADIYYTIAATLAILYGTSRPFSHIGNLGDAEDKARNLNACD